MRGVKLKGTVNIEVVNDKIKQEVLKEYGVPWGYRLSNGILRQRMNDAIDLAIQKTRYDCEKKHLENDIRRVETNPAIPEDKKREIVKKYKEDFDKKFGVDEKKQESRENQRGSSKEV